MAIENKSKRPRIIKELNLEQIKGEGSPQGVLYGLRGTIFLDLLTNIFYEGQNSLTWNELGAETEANGLFYKGYWNANINTPTLTSGIGTTGNFYVVDVAGTTNLNGITDWDVGDWAVFVKGATNSWQKIDNSNNRTFVFTQGIPATTWTIQHNLGKFPSVSVVNNNNVLLYGETTYIDSNELTINFSAGFSGKAYLN